MLRNVFSYLILTNQIDIAEPKIYHHLGFFTRIWRLTWRVSDCEEWMVVTHTEDDQTTLFVL